MKLTQHIYFYKGLDYVPLFGLTSSNTCVIRGERLTMVDPGPSVGPHLWRVEKAMKQDHLRLDNVMKIILTHAHPDHAQGLHALAGRLVEQTYCHPFEKRILQDPRRMWDEEYDCIGPFERELMILPRAWIEWLARRMYGAMRPVAENVVPVRDGAVLNLGIPARVVELPGHRPGEIGIHLPGEKALIIGDLINWDMFDIPALNMPTSDLRQAMASLNTIRNMDVELLVPAHDEPVRGRMKIREWLDAALDRCARMLRDAEQALSEHPDIPLSRLGRILAAGSRHHSFFHRRMLAFNVLKALNRDDG